jgi:hypothetical protein
MTAQATTLATACWGRSMPRQAELASRSPTRRPGKHRSCGPCVRPAAPPVPPVPPRTTGAQARALGGSDCSQPKPTLYSQLRSRGAKLGRDTPKASFHVGSRAANYEHRGAGGRISAAASRPGRPTGGGLAGHLDTLQWQPESASPVAPPQLRGGASHRLNRK